MKTFKVKDLMISVEDKADLEKDQVALCPVVSHIGCHTFVSICHWQCSFQPSLCYWGCTFIPSYVGCGPYAPSPIGCGPISPVCLWSNIPDPFGKAGDPEIGGLREKMQELQKAYEAQFGPKTIEDATLLEAKLNEALEELRAQKANLKKGK